MTNGRNIAITAALAGVMTAPLVFGSSPARADELADLRANQELLQQRLDQLAQIPAVGGQYGGGPPGPTTVQMMGGSFPRSFLIPGTDTSIRVGGRATMIFNYWITGGNPQNPNHTAFGNNGAALAIPLHIHTPAGNPARSRGNNVNGATPRQSMVSVETRTPTAWGEARSFISWDFNNNTADANVHVADNLAPRLLFAYGTLGGLLFGQANSNFADPDAGAETLDYGGNIGNQGVVRLPQVRYTQPLAPWGIPGALSMSVEVPETDFWKPATGITNSDSATGFPGKNSAPDLTAAWYIPQPWGHMDFAAVVRP
ncbi:MAG TPA: porin, partial [Stellaceae bacterium]|nr:porin [Stellaceae bacterium]